MEDADELASKLLELVDVLPREMKRDIVLCLPDIIDDRAAETVVRSLRDKLEDGGTHGHGFNHASTCCPMLAPSQFMLLIW